MDDKIDWADVPADHVGPFAIEETPQEETVAKSVSVDRKDEKLTPSDNESVSSMELDSEGMDELMLKKIRKLI